MKTIEEYKYLKNQAKEEQKRYHKEIYERDVKTILEYFEKNPLSSRSTIDKDIADYFTDLGFSVKSSIEAGMTVYYITIPD